MSNLYTVIKDYPYSTKWTGIHHHHAIFVKGEQLRVVGRTFDGNGAVVTLPDGTKIGYTIPMSFLEKTS